MRRGGETTGALLLLIATTVVLTWPLAARLPSAVSDPGDPLLASWILAWDLHALARAPGRLFDANIFHPHRATLAYSEHLLGLIPLAAPARLLGGGPVLAHNVVLFLTFPLSGLTMFWLVRHLTGHPGAGLLAGLVYAFSHYRFAQLGHVQVLGHMWLPLLLHALHRSVASRGRWRDLALAAAAFLLQALTSAYHAAFAALLTALFGLWVAAPAGRPPLGRLARRGLVVAAAVAALLAPVVLPYDAVRRDLGVARPIAEVEQYAARPTAYLAAPPVSVWFGGVTAAFRRPEGALLPGVLVSILAAVGIAAAGRTGGAPRPAARAAAEPGHAGRWPGWLDPIVALALGGTLVNLLLVGGLAVDLGPLRFSQRDFGWALTGLAAVLAARRLLNGRATPLHGLGRLGALGWPHAVGFYALLVGLAVLCSLGPTLPLDGDVALHPLYRQLYDRLPGFDALRVPARFAVLVNTGLAVLAGYGAAALARAARRPVAARAALAATGLLALVEVWPVPIPFRDAPAAAGPVERWLATSGAPGPVAVLPFYNAPGAHWETRRLLGSTTHWRPLVNGYSGIFPPGYWATVDTLNAFPAPEAVARLRALGVRYAVVELWAYPPAWRSRVVRALESPPPGLDRISAWNGTVLYEVRPGP